LKSETLRQLFVSFMRIGGFTFGGGYSMLPMLEKEIVDLRGWATQDEIVNTFAIAQCTPGIIAINAATYIGNGQAGVLGGIAAALGVITPSLIVILIIASILNNFIDIAVVQYALAGIRAGVCALVLKTVISLIKNNVKDILSVLLFAVTLIASVFLKVSPVAPVMLAIFVGVVFMKEKEAEL